LTNLAINSLTHAFGGGRKVTIDVRVHAAGKNSIEVLFADNGCGMTSDVKRQAFDPFFTTRRHEGASGLGLHVVHSIVVDRLGGQLTLESEPGVGTTVQFILPRTAQH
jgi:signal transduction histidine kinase